MKWSIHPAKKNPRQTLLVLAIGLLTSGVVLWSLHSIFFSALALVFLTHSLAPFLFPTHFEISADGVEEKRLGITKSRKWSEFQRLELGKRGCFLSPFKTPRWLDRYRGITLLTPEQRHDEIMSFVQARYKEAHVDERYN